MPSARERSGDVSSRQVNRRLIPERVDPHHRATGRQHSIDFARKEQHVDHHDGVECTIDERQDRRITTHTRRKLPRGVGQHLSGEVERHERADLTGQHAGPSAGSGPKLQPPTIYSSGTPSERIDDRGGLRCINMIGRPVSGHAVEQVADLLRPFRIPGTIERHLPRELAHRVVWSGERLRKGDVRGISQDGQGRRESIHLNSLTDSVAHMVALRLKTSTQPQPDFLHLPWTTPLDEWPDEFAVRLPRGRHRHVVRFIEHEGSYFALKELPPNLANREFELLTFLKEEHLPVVDLVGVAHERIDADGNPLEAVLITRHLTYSLPYLHLFAAPGGERLHEKLIDALTVLLVRIHLVGLFWGDCSLGNALFRRDAGNLVAYLVDTETGERHDQLSDGQRQYDLQIAKDNMAGGLFELEHLGKLGEAVDPIEVVDLLQIRYDELWTELTRTDAVGADEQWRIRDRLRRLNELGFDTAEMELVERNGTQVVLFRPAIVEEGHHKRKLSTLTGIEAEENQARRLLDAMRGYGMFLTEDVGRPLPEAVVAYRWLTERYEPTIAAIPEQQRGKLVDAEIYHQVLDHLWYLSEEAGRDVGLADATDSYVKTILERLPDERTLISSDDEIEGI